MSYEAYRMMFIIFGILALLFLVVTVILFFTLKISMVIGDLTGTNARKAIEQIRQDSANDHRKTGHTGNHTSRIHGRSGKTGSGKTGKKHTGNAAQKAESTAPAGQRNSPVSEGLPVDPETSVLGTAASTAEQTTVLSCSGPAAATTVLAQETNQTTVLDQTASVLPAEVVQTQSAEPLVTVQAEKAEQPAETQREKPTGYGLTDVLSNDYRSTIEIEFDITYVHSDVVIP